MPFWLSLTILVPLLFLQNAAFTWSSRSRNSGDWKYHWWASLASNGVYIATNSLVANLLWKAFNDKVWTQIGVLSVVYTVVTSAGSVFMMRYLLNKESGKRKVGA